MRLVGFSIGLFLTLLSFSQIPIYDFRDLEKTTKLPATINSERSCVVVHVPDDLGSFRKVGEWEKMAEQAHKGFVTMGIDVVLYLNHYDLMASVTSKMAYANLFASRKIENLIFLTKKDTGIELVITPFNSKETFIDNDAISFYVEGSSLEELLLKTGKEVRRANYEINNFLIPEKPNFLSGISIVDNSLLKNYPGILRRSTLAVEKFARLPMPKNAKEEVIRKIDSYNLQIDEMNVELDSLIKNYPYEYVVIDPMSEEDLLRNRHQFVLRCISGQASTLRQMFEYPITPSETDFISLIPLLPDQTRAKPIPREALVHKFYIRQNVSKNIHVGEWDADETWQEALHNMIGSLIQEHELDK